MANPKIGLQLSTVAATIREIGVYETMKKIAEIGIHHVEVSQVLMNEENINLLLKAKEDFGIQVSAMTAIMKAMGEGGNGASAFMEDYTYHLVEGQEYSLGAHMLEVCPCCAEGKAKIEVHALGIGDREAPARLVFEGKEGDAIVASLIEKETDGKDHGKIASVINNRLNTNGETVGKLQIDATLAYINGGKAPTEADKQIDSPYNTYLYKGLPAGPISNPGMESIQAAMHPEKTNYFYYALGDDGVHHFNTNYDAHVNFINSQQLYKK